MTDDARRCLSEALIHAGLVVPEPISLSKYRVGMSLVGAVATSDPQPGSELFDRS